MTEWLHFHFLLSCFGEGNGNPLQCSCLENPRDREAWWAAVYGVAQSWTWLERLSSSSSRGTQNSQPGILNWMTFWLCVILNCFFSFKTWTQGLTSWNHSDVLVIRLNKVPYSEFQEQIFKTVILRGKILLFRNLFWEGYILLMVSLRSCNILPHLMSAGSSIGDETCKHMDLLLIRSSSGDK